MEYRNHELRAKDAVLADHGGIEGVYRSRAAQGYSRKQIADMLRMSVPALAAWITKWNKARVDKFDSRPMEDSKP